MDVRSDRFAEVEDRLAGYQVCDRSGEKIGVRTGFFGLRRTLIPIEALRINEERQLIEISQPKDKVEDAPHFDDYEEITAEFEWQVRSYFGLGSAMSASERYPGVAMGDAHRERTVLRAPALVFGEGVTGPDDFRAQGRGRT